jgi:hypothetical protein
MSLFAKKDAASLEMPFAFSRLRMYIAQDGKLFLDSKGSKMRMYLICPLFKTEANCTHVFNLSGTYLSLLA